MTTYNKLEKKLIENRCELRSTKDLARKRELIKENHEIMTALDASWK